MTWAKLTPYTNYFFNENDPLVIMGNKTKSFIHYRYNSTDKKYVAIERFTKTYNTDTLVSSTIHEVWNGSAWQNFQKNELIYYPNGDFQDEKIYSFTSGKWALYQEIEDNNVYDSSTGDLVSTYRVTQVGTSKTVGEKIFIEYNNVTSINNEVVANNSLIKIIQNPIENNKLLVSGLTKNTDYQIVRSPKSYNSQVGVPLSVWQMNETHTLAIFEAGISAEGEMQKLQEIVAPTIGIFSNIGEAHSEGFRSIADKLAEKLVLFKSSQLLVYCKDQLLVDEMIQKKIKEGHFAEIISWGMNIGADINILEKKVGTKRTDIKASYKNTEYTFAIPYSDPAAIENAMHCFAAAIV
jgi:hypothetical protein